jgi:dTDP-4-dehydrorhamnose 3,5-epimerase
VKIYPTTIHGVLLVEQEPARDERGYFVRTFCAREMAAHGISTYLAQASLSFNAKRGTLRGLHFQSHPAMEDKLVRCARGAIFDVIVDIRLGSPSFGSWVGYELSDTNHRQLYAPAGTAHGFQALTDDAVVSYQISQFYEADKSAGIRFDDPAIGIAWPLPPTAMSPRDLHLPLLAQVDPARLMPVEDKVNQ